MKTLREMASAAASAAGRHKGDEELARLSVALWRAANLHLAWVAMCNEHDTFAILGGVAKGHYLGVSAYVDTDVPDGIYNRHSLQKVQDLPPSESQAPVGALVGRLSHSFGGGVPVDVFKYVDDVATVEYKGVTYKLTREQARRARMDLCETVQLLPGGEILGRHKYGVFIINGAYYDDV